MAPSINYYCPCISSATMPPAPNLASSSASFHPLHTLYFCEECDAIRCNRCVAVEVSGYYCPNCLFEVPTASVRAERNRCARNCFQCPHCRNTLSVVPSDPPDDSLLRSTSSQAGAMGEPPFLLYCNNCRWDSAEVGITFEKPTGLAQQLQRSEDSAPELLEFERLKDFFEPLLRSSSSTNSAGTSHHTTHFNPITAAASSALARDVPGVERYRPQPRSRTKTKQGSKDDVPPYRARVEIGGSNGFGTGGDGDVDFMMHLETPVEVARLEQRWTNSWSESRRAKDLKPIRIPLHSRLTKRCPACRHILIKPEQKAQSVRFKIKLVAANYIPAIIVHVPLPQPAIPSRKPAAQKEDDSSGNSRTQFLAGKTYPFQLSFTNPLYDPIQVRLVVQRHQTPAAPPEDPFNEDKDKPRRPPYTINLPSTAFSIAAFAEAWEYEDDEEMYGIDDDDLLGLSPVKDRGARGKVKTVGVLEKKANTTVIGGEVMLGRDARGDVKFNTFVTYTYRSDEPPEEGDAKPAATPSKREPVMKTFSFYTIVDLGTIVPREETRAEPPEP